MHPIPTLMTARLTLRAPRVEDFEPFAAFLASDRAEMERGRQDRDGAWLHFSSAVSGWVLRGYGAFSVTDRRTGGYLGEAGVFREHNYPEPELGWMVVSEAEGKGIAFEAARAVRDWANDALGLTTLVSYIAPENARSVRLAERLGAARDDAAPRPWADCLAYRHPGPEAPA